MAVEAKNTNKDNAVMEAKAQTVKLENCQSVQDWLNTEECKSLPQTGFDLGLSALARELGMQVGDTVVLECMPESFKTVGTTEFNKDKVAIYWQPASEEIESTQSFVSYLGNNKSTPLSNLHIGDTQTFVASLYAIPIDGKKSAEALEAYKADLAAGNSKNEGKAYARGGITLQPAKIIKQGQA